MIHKAAKEAFDKYAGEKVLKVKVLREGYRKLGGEKKVAYGEYRDLRQELVG